MARPISPVQSHLDLPVIFRTTAESVYRSTITTGEVWLRSDECYRNLEDRVRSDTHESLSTGRHQFPLFLQAPTGDPMPLEGDGGIAERVPAHYILSLHGSSIAEEVRNEFGGFTFGVENIDLLARQLFEECRKQVACKGWNWDQVRYQHSALRISEDGTGAPIQFGHDPSRCLRIYNPNPFKKRPITPFILQDEWRIVIWTDGYLRNNPNEALKVRVPSSMFYQYLEGPVS